MTESSPHPPGRGGRGRGRGRGGRGRGRGSGTSANPPSGRGEGQPPAGATQARSSASSGGRSGRGRGGNRKGGDSKKDPKDEIKKVKKTEQDKKADKKDEKVKNDPAKKSLEEGKKAKQKKNEPQKTNAKDNNGNKLSQPMGSLVPSIPPSQPQQTSDINYGKGQSITVLHVAEKPSIAQAIAKGLCSGSFNTLSRGLPVHDFTSPPFPKAPHATSCRHKVTSVTGHVFSVDFESKFQSWDAVDPAELFDAPIVRKANSGGTVKHLQSEAKGVDFIVLWMDCDREGENINFEVLSICQKFMNGGDDDKSAYNRVYRAYFSAINPSDIKKAYQALGKPDRNQSLSVDARQELDLKVGVAFSRFQTRFFQGRYGDLDSAVLSYGPCQTPTLGFCVQRHIDIQTFKPEPFWTLELSVFKRGRNLRALWNGGRSFNKDKIESLVVKAIESKPICVVKDIVKKEKKQGRPIPLNTVALLKACSKALGIGPHSAMQTAERLYLSGYLSYPRTESSSYPQSFDINGTLKQQSTDARWGRYVQELLRDGPLISNKGTDMGDHPPITPCRPAREGELSGDMARVYDLVVRHFIASVSKDAVWASTRIDFDVESLGDQGIFTLRGKELVSSGFLAVLLHKEYGESDDLAEGEEDEEEEERSIPEFSKGELIPMTTNTTKADAGKVNVSVSESVRASLDIKEKMTTAPGYLTESELIGKMEKNGIGTDASIPTHIENIQKRNYVSLQTGRRLVPNKLGIVLVQGYHQIDSSLVLPQVRSDIEDQCNKIAKGLASRESVTKKAILLFREKFNHFVKKIDRMDVLFGSSFSKIEDMGKPFTRCGLTRRYLQYIPGPPQRLYNKWTETVYPLPSGGIVKQWTGRACPVENCGFELCMYSTGQPQRTFPLCPRCFNDPDWALDETEFPEDAVDRADAAKEKQLKSVAGRQLVLECPLPDNHPSIDDLAVGTDDEDGLLVLDAHLGPKWRLVSTRSPIIIHFPKSIEKIVVLEKKNRDDGVRMMSVEFKSGQSPLPDGATKYTTCYDEDSLLQNLCNTFHGSDRLKATPRGGGRGRGRGGRGRPGGRGGRGRGRR